MGRFGDIMGREWRTLFMILFPLVASPILLAGDKKSQCAYVVVIMAAFWMAEIWPLAVTALLPLVCFPLMGIMNSDTIARTYMTNTTMMLVGSIIIAISIEHSNLHRRIALMVILCVGCTPRRLHIGLCVATMIVSMWLSNSAATAMMCPVVEASLKELEAQGILDFWEKTDDPNPDHRVPTRITMCYFIGCAYASSCGGVGTPVGTGTNLAFKGLYEVHVGGMDEIAFHKWMFVGIPIMLLTTALIIPYLQIVYMGLFRPNSKEGKAMAQAAAAESFIRESIKKEYAALGKPTFHEIMTAICFIITVALWLLRKPELFPGWEEIRSDPKFKIKDSAAAFIGILLMFYIPKEPTFFKLLTRTGERTGKASDPCLTWEVIHDKNAWGLMFLIGGGFAMSGGMLSSGLTTALAEQLKPLTEQGKFLACFVGCLMANLVTEMCSNVVTCNMVVPILLQMANDAKVHPLYLSMPAGIVCSFAWCLPVGTPPNIIIYKFCNMPTKELILAGLGANVLGLVGLFAFFPWLFDLVFDVLSTPEWLEIYFSNLGSTESSI